MLAVIRVLFSSLPPKFQVYRGQELRIHWIDSNEMTDQYPHCLYQIRTAILVDMKRGICTDNDVTRVCVAINKTKILLWYTLSIANSRYLALGHCKKDFLRCELIVCHFCSIALLLKFVVHFRKINVRKYEWFFRRKKWNGDLNTEINFSYSEMNNFARIY